MVGEPSIYGSGRRLCLSLKEKDRNGPPTNKILDWSLKMGRFLGYFLADGHLGPDDRNQIIIDFGPGEQRYVDDFVAFADSILHRSVSVVSHGNALRCQVSHKSLASWLRKHCYDGKSIPRCLLGRKRFPLHIEDLKAGTVEGVLVGLIRGDGWVDGNGIHFGNSSESLIIACHLLFGRLGLTSTVTVREPRDVVLFDGRTIQGDSPEWTVHVTGIDGMFFRNLVEGGLHECRAPRVWREGGFRCTRVRAVDELEYDGLVHDLTVEGDPSFCAPYITLHNSGMTNVALAVNTVEALSFSVARGGDWIDKHAAMAVGATQARICALKEAGIDLMTPKNRDEEALGLYYKALIEHALDQVAARFEAIKSQFSLPKAIPMVVSGGTSRAGNFLEFFKKVWGKKKRRFPIEVSEIRQAKDPLNAVVLGLLVQALQEYEK